MAQFPSGTVARLYRQPPAPLANHGAILAFAGRPREPSLYWNHGKLHAILKFRGVHPEAGWPALAIIAEAIDRGGSGWLIFDSLADAHAVIKTISQNSNFHILYN